MLVVVVDENVNRIPVLMSRNIQNGREDVAYVTNSYYI